MKFVRMTKIIELITGIGVTQDYSLKVNNIIVVQSTSIIDLFRKYSTFFFEYENESLLEHFDFYAKWLNYVERTKNNFEMMYKAYNNIYNPTENYSKISEIFDGKKNDDITITSTPSGKLKNTVEMSKTTFDSVTPVLTDKQENSQTFEDGAKTETSTEYENTLTDSFDGTTQENYNEINKHLEKTTGNIGVQTGAEMIEKETNIRLNDFILKYVKCFIDEVCIYINEEGEKNEAVFI